MALVVVPIEQGVCDAFALRGSWAACVGRGTRSRVAEVVSTGEGAWGIRSVCVHFVLSIDCEFPNLFWWQIIFNRLCVLLEEYMW